MFGFDTGLFITSKPKNFVKLTGEQQHPTRRTVLVCVHKPGTRPRDCLLEQGPMSTGLCGRPLCTRDTPMTPAVCPVL